jgi:diguanylate cyclase (GGDEF)-like protein
MRREIMLSRVDDWLTGQSRLKLLIIVLALILVLGVTDYRSGSELSFYVFYTCPIMLAAWYGGRPIGLTAVITSACVWYLADISSDIQYSVKWIPYWNTGIRFLSFLIIHELLLLVRNKLKQQSSLAGTDPLTGLANGRAFYDRIDNELARLQRYPQVFSIAYIDLDNFKQVNDTFGHDMGDEVLKAVAMTMKEQSRSTDCIARLGGDEFATLFPMADGTAVDVIIAKMRDKLISRMQVNGWPVTFSIGVITFTKPMDNIRDMVKMVDDQMYMVKKSGKNDVRHLIWPEPN